MCQIVSLFPRAVPLPMYTAVCPMREVLTRAFRERGSSTRAGGRPFLIIVSLQHSTNSDWVGVLISTVCPLPRHGHFPSALHATSTCTGMSAQPPTDIRLRFADTFASANKVFCRWPCARGFLPALPENGFYEDHTTLVVILCTLQQSFPCQLLLFQCWGPCGILHWTLHTETCSRKRHTEGKTPRHAKFWYPCRDLCCVIYCHSKVFMVQATRLYNLVCNLGNTCGLFRGTWECVCLCVCYIYINVFFFWGGGAILWSPPFSWY